MQSRFVANKDSELSFSLHVAPVKTSSQSCSTASAQCHQKHSVKCSFCQIDVILYARSLGQTHPDLESAWHSQLRCAFFPPFFNQALPWYLAMLNRLEILGAAGAAVRSHVVPRSTSRFSNVRQWQHRLRKCLADIGVMVLRNVIVDLCPEFVLGQAPTVFNAHSSHFWAVLSW